MYNTAKVIIFFDITNKILEISFSEFGSFNHMYYLCVIKTERRRAGAPKRDLPNTTSKHFGKLIKHI